MRRQAHEWQLIPACGHGGLAIDRRRGRQREQVIDREARTDLTRRLAEGDLVRECGAHSPSGRRQSGSRVRRPTRVAAGVSSCVVAIPALRLPSPRIIGPGVFNSSQVPDSLVHGVSVAAARAGPLPSARSWYQLSGRARRALALSPTDVWATHR